MIMFDPIGRVTPSSRHRKEIPGPIRYIPQRTRHPWTIQEIVVWTVTTTLWGLRQGKKKAEGGANSGRPDK